MCVCLGGFLCGCVSVCVGRGFVWFVCVRGCVGLCVGVCVGVGFMFEGFFKYGLIACSITFVILQAIHNLQIYIYISSDFSVTILRLVCRTVFLL